MRGPAAPMRQGPPQPPSASWAGGGHPVPALPHTPARLPPRHLPAVRCLRPALPQTKRDRTLALGLADTWLSQLHHLGGSYGPSLGFCSHPCQRDSGLQLLRAPAWSFTLPEPTSQPHLSPQARQCPAPIPPSQKSPHSEGDRRPDRSWHHGCRPATSVPPSDAPLAASPPPGESPPFRLASSGQPPSASLAARVTSCDLGSTITSLPDSGWAGTTQEAGAAV
ncbi:uncharacterized protein LOC124519227 [Lynx rufus]|uniref:uncharacterized protein LOC124519227 n=1 Tax=Lynx rufus TaxID=61384 RepID=UPI001F124CEC|nr:uncharacterized protein LOC124519227 [Lynx rufus]